MTSSVELDFLGQIHKFFTVTLLLSLHKVVIESIELLDISCMMLAVVKLHLLLRNDRLKTINRVRKRLLNGMIRIYFF